MNAKQLLKCAFSAMIILGAFNSPLMANNPFEACAKELATYFPELLVNETLKKFHVPEDKWAAIRKELAEKDKNIVREVERKAEGMHPNPLKDPQQRQAAVKLFKETLFTAFADTLHNQGIADDAQIQAMLEDLQVQKAKKFAACLEKHKAELVPAKPSTMSEEKPVESRP